MYQRPKKTQEELHKLFSERHREWEAVNNPAGFESGEVFIKWNERIDALLVLVRSKG